MTTYNFGDVVLVPFPFTNQTASKNRPAVVVSANNYQRERSDLILIAVTSQNNPATAFGEMTIVDWKAAGLLKASIVKPVLTTIEITLVLRKLGELQNRDRQTLQNLLQTILGQ